MCALSQSAGTAPTEISWLYINANSWLRQCLRRLRQNRCQSIGTTTRVCFQPINGRYYVSSSDFSITENSTQCDRFTTWHNTIVCNTNRRKVFIKNICLVLDVGDRQTIVVQNYANITMVTSTLCLYTYLYYVQC